MEAVELERCAAAFADGLVFIMLVPLTDVA